MAVFGWWRSERSPVGKHLDGARDTIRAHAPESSAIDVIDEVEVSLDLVVADCDRLERALEELDPHRATSDLKAALRTRPSATVPDTPEIVALRRRHHTVSGLNNRLDDLRGRIERTMIDVDTLVAQTVAAALAPTGTETMLAARLQQLTDDARALAAAHDEVAGL